MLPTQSLHCSYVTQMRPKFRPQDRVQCCAKAGRIKYQLARCVSISTFCLLLLPGFVEQAMV